MTTLTTIHNRALTYILLSLLVIAPSQKVLAQSQASETSAPLIDEKNDSSTEEYTWRAVFNTIFKSYKAFHYSDGKRELPYRLHTPKTYNDTDKDYPLFIFMHGAGQKGSDNIYQLKEGGDMFVSPEVQGKEEFFVLLPQAPAGREYWNYVKPEYGSSERIYDYSNTPQDPIRLLMELVSDIQKLYRIDASRIYIGGRSAGALGTLEILARDSETFAAAYIIAGLGDINYVKEIAKTPTWFFHGDADETISVEEGTRMHQAILDAGGESKITVYPGVSHSGSSRALYDSNLYDWLLSHKK